MDHLREDHEQRSSSRDANSAGPERPSGGASKQPRTSKRGPPSAGARVSFSPPLARTPAGLETARLSPLFAPASTGARHFHGVEAGERKVVTVLFADVQSSMHIAEHLDPEEWHSFMNELFQTFSEVVEHFDGTVHQFTGDGALALFGAPLAQEDHAQRACYAALMLRSDFAAYSDLLRRDHAIDFHVRMGLNSGEVVVGTLGGKVHPEYAAVGHAVGLASRMQALARPGSVCLTRHTAHLVEGLFELQALGPVKVKGAALPIEVYELLRPTRHHTLFDVGRARGLTPFVGRTVELEWLEQACRRAHAGQGQAVCIVGTAGVGKSRLCHEFAQRCATRGVAVFRAQGLAHGRQLPFMPVLQLLRQLFGIVDEDGADAVRTKVTEHVVGLSSELRGLIPLLQTFMGATAPDRGISHLTPEALQQRLFDGLRQLLRAEGRARPLVLLFEDVQCFDDASTSWLEQFIPLLPETSLLVVTTCRGEFRIAWMDSFACLRVELAALDDATSLELWHELLGRGPELTRLAERMQARTNGNPLFMEEVVRDLAAGGTLAGRRGGWRLAQMTSSFEMPLTVQALLAARIDRLAPTDKRVLQTAAVIGSTFSEPIACRVVGLDRHVVADALSRLVDSGFLTTTAFHPDVTYRFTHPLMQETALHAQLGSRRQHIHLDTAYALADSRNPEDSSQTAEIAGHLLGAGPLAPAGDVALYAAAAGDRASSLYAFADARRFYEAALKATKRLPSPSRLEEARIRANLARALGRVGNLELAQKVGDEAIRLFEALQEPGTADRVRLETAHMFKLHAQMQAALPYLRPLVAKVGRHPTVLRGIALADYAVVCDFLGQSKRMLPTARRVLRLARQLQSTPLEQKALIVERNWYLNNTPHWKRVEVMNRRLLNNARAMDDYWEESRARGHLAFCLLLRGRVKKALEALRPQAEEERRIGSAAHIIDERAVRMIAYCFRGAWDHVDREWAETLPYLTHAPGALRLGLLVWARVQTDVWRGTPSVTLPSPRKNYAEMDMAEAAILASTALRMSEENAPEDAAELLRSAMRLVPAKGDGLLWFIAAQALSAAWSNLGDASSAARWYGSLCAYKDTLYLSGTNLQLGRVAALNGWLEDALQHLNASIRHSRRENLRVLLALSLYEKGRLLLQAEQLGRRETAARALREAVHLFEDLEMSTLCERVQHLL